MSQMPDDIMFEIASHITELGDLWNLCRTHPTFRKNLPRFIREAHIIKFYVSFPKSPQYNDVVNIQMKKRMTEYGARRELQILRTIPKTQLLPHEIVVPLYFQNDIIERDPYLEKFVDLLMFGDVVLIDTPKGMVKTVKSFCQGFQKDDKKYVFSCILYFIRCAQ